MGRVKQLWRVPENSPYLGLSLRRPVSETANRKPEADWGNYSSRNHLSL